jgi:hypothetical protein
MRGLACTQRRATGRLSAAIPHMTGSRLRLSLLCRRWPGVSEIACLYFLFRRSRMTTAKLQLPISPAPAPRELYFFGRDSGGTRPATR